MKLLGRDPLLSLVNNYVVDSPTTANINYVWNVGSILGLILVIQLITGITLAFHYQSDISIAFDSVEHIMRDVWFGAFIRYAHANGAALFFIFVYIHIAKAIYYGSYRKPRVALWNVGIVIFILMMAIGFLGYCLPFGSMSYWGSTVITSMFSAIPLIGTDLTEFIWGGFSVNNATISRFYALHFLLPFVLIALVVVHLIYLHVNGSSNPLGISTNNEKLPFHPYFIFKDIYGFIIVIFILVYIITVMPNTLGHSDNYIPADPLVTPSSIVPEFYFLSFYAILRAVPNKLFGVILMFAAILILFLLPYIDNSNLRSNTMKPLGKVLYWLFIANFFLLTWLGGQHATYYYVMASQLCTVVYFLYFLIGINYDTVFNKFK